MVQKLLSFLAVATLASGICVRADPIQVFTGSQAGLCCFNVTLDQVSPTEISVRVDLAGGAQYFVHTGNGDNHPGFAMFLAGPPFPPYPGNLTVQNISLPWTLTSVSYDPVTTNGPAMGTFNFDITNPGNGANAHNAGPLVFDLIDPDGFSFANFGRNDLGFYFEADIRDAAGVTGTSGISNGPPPPPVPEPSMLLLLGSGLVAATGVLRRRFAHK